METVIESSLPPQTRAAVLAHYEHAAEVIALDFPLAPVVAIGYPKGFGEDPSYTASWHQPLPKTIPYVDVGPANALKRYAAIDRNALLWLVHRGAVGFESWTPSPRDPDSVGYARVLLSPRNGATQEQLAYAMLDLRGQLRERHAEAIAILDGRHGAALFVPFADLPAYEAVRLWLHAVANAAAEHSPALLTTETHPKEARIHIAVSSNAVGRCSSLPYTLAGTPELGMVTPIDWSELGSIHNGTITAANSAKRLALGDRFTQEAAVIGLQPFSKVRT
jgi:DNA primase